MMFQVTVAFLIFNKDHNLSLTLCLNISIKNVNNAFLATVQVEIVLQEWKQIKYVVIEQFTISSGSITFLLKSICCWKCVVYKCDFNLCIYNKSCTSQLMVYGS